MGEVPGRGQDAGAVGNDSLPTHMKILQNFSPWNRQTDAYQLNNM